MIGSVWEQTSWDADAWLTGCWADAAAVTTFAIPDEELHRPSVTGKRLKPADDEELEMIAMILLMGN